MSTRILEELKKRAERPRFSIREHCFDKQIKFIEDPAKFKTAVCSRRAGKTEACAADLWDTAEKFPGVNVLYITLSRVTAKRIIWKILLSLRRKYDPDAKVDNTDLTITLTNGSTIYLSGAKDESEVEKLRGMSFKKVYIDECQSFRSYIESLVDDIIVPALYDHDGSLILIGTPGPLCSGYFYNAAHGTGWSQHKWTMLDNPWIKIKSGKTPEEILRLERERRGITAANPTYRRESLGEWVQDTNSLVYTFNTQKNIWQKFPEGKMDYIFGVDIGYVDSDAIAVLGYNHSDNNVYLIEEIVAAKQDITTLANKVKELKATYNPLKIVMDAGALGKKIQEEIRVRHGLFMEAAEKTRKFEFIELLNDDLRTAKFKAFTGSLFEQDSYLVQWDRTKPKLTISDTYHTDIGDAVLYAWRECKHFFIDLQPESVHRDSDRYMELLEQKLADQMNKPADILDLPSQEEMDSLFSDD